MKRWQFFLAMFTAGTVVARPAMQLYDTGPALDHVAAMPTAFVAALVALAVSFKIPDADLRRPKSYSGAALAGFAVIAVLSFGLWYGQHSG